MKVLCHSDPHVLERELARRVASAQRSDPLAPVLVVVPTGRLAGHVQKRLAAERDAWLGVEVLHFHGLAHTILEAAGAAAPRVMTKRILEAVLDGVLRERSLAGNRWSRFVIDRPGARRSLLNTLHELREAGIDAGMLENAAGRRERDLAAVYRRYEERLSSLEDHRNLADRAGFLRQAVRHAGPYARRFEAILLHGVYELVGMHLDLLRALDGGGAVTVLLPASPRDDAPAGAYARRFARSHLLGEGEALRPLEGGGPGGLLGDRLDALYDEGAALDPMEGDAVRLRNFQGGSAEVEWAVRGALAAVAEGIPPRDIAIVARSLEPYGAQLEAALEETDVPWTTSLEPPLRREPAVHDLMLLLHVVDRGFPRAATAELLGSSHLRWESLVPGSPPPSGDLAESWSRSAGVLGGVEEWTGVLTGWASRSRPMEDGTDDEREREAARTARRQEEAAVIADAVLALHRRCRGERSGSWNGHADELENLVRDLLPAAAGAIYPLLDEMRSMDDLHRERPEVSEQEAHFWLESAVDETGIAGRAADDGGIRVLDVMQARGLTFGRLFLVGFQGGLFPRAPQEDPFLADRVRSRLRRETGRPLPLKMEGEEEEHLLLGLSLGSAGERLRLSWQRTDEAGRALAPSMGLREVARLILGRPDLAAVVEKVSRRTPAHPLQRLETVLARLEMLSPADERLLLALRGAGRNATSGALVERSGKLAHGLRMLASTESFAPGSLPYDGRIGSVLPLPEPLSVTALQQLGRCPLQFLFQRLLRVAPLDEERSAVEPPEWEIGNAVHRVLESIYRTLQEEDLFHPASAERLVARAGELLGPAWRDATAALRARTGRQLESLWVLHEERWLDSIRWFLEDDLRRLAGADPGELKFEHTVQAVLDLGEGVRRGVLGRVDRLAVLEESREISDYKSSGNVKEMCDRTAMLRGLQLQVPLYALLEGTAAGYATFDDRIRVRLLGIGPQFDPGQEERELRPEFGALRDVHKEGLRETLRVLVSQAAGGTFPLRSDRHCKWCSYRAACRRNHPPTQRREECDAGTQDFRDLSRKTMSKKPTLAAVREEQA